MRKPFIQLKTPVLLATVLLMMMPGVLHTYPTKTNQNTNSNHVY